MNNSPKQQEKCRMPDADKLTAIKANIACSGYKIDESRLERIAEKLIARLKSWFF